MESDIVQLECWKESRRVPDWRSQPRGWFVKEAGARGVEGCTDTEGLDSDAGEGSRCVHWMGKGLGEDAVIP